MRIPTSRDYQHLRLPTEKTPYWHILLFGLVLFANTIQADTVDTTSPRNGRAGEGLNIVVSVPPLATLVRNLAPSAHVSVLFTTEQTLHSGSINAHHLKLIRYANLVLSTQSIDEQNHLGQVMKKFKNTRWQVLTQPIASDHGWLLPINGESYVSQLVDTLSDLNPRQRQLFTHNASPLLADLQRWEMSFTTIIAKLNAPIFSIHSALGGFSTHYGLTVHSYEVHGHDPGPADHEIWLLRAQQLLPCCILAPKSSAEGLGRKLATQTGAKLFLFEPLSPHLEQTYQTLDMLFKEVGSNGHL